MFLQPTLKRIEFYTHKNFTKSEPGQPFGPAKLVVAMNNESQEETGISVVNLPDDESDAIQALEQLNELVRMTRWRFEMRC